MSARHVHPARHGFLSGVGFASAARMALSAVMLSLASVVAVSLASLVGLFALSIDARRLQRLTTPFVSFAVGALLGDAFIHLIPATFTDVGDRPTTQAAPSSWHGGRILAGDDYFQRGVPGVTAQVTSRHRVRGGPMARTALGQGLRRERWPTAPSGC